MDRGAAFQAREKNRNKKKFPEYSRENFLDPDTPVTIKILKYSMIYSSRYCMDWIKVFG